MKLEWSSHFFVCFQRRERNFTKDEVFYLLVLNRIRREVENKFEKVVNTLSFEAFPVASGILFLGRMSDRS